MQIHYFGFFSASLYALLAVFSHQEDGPSLASFFLIMSLLAAICFFIFFRVSRFEGKANTSLLGDGAGITITFKDVILWAFVFRLIGIFGFPIYEDDYFRYLWDAYLFSSTGSPYGPAPSEFFGVESIEPIYQSILSGINYPDVSTIYGPITQLSFLLAHWLSPGEVWGLQLVYAVTDMLLVMVLKQFTHAKNLLLYAWCPLAVKETAFTAHPDGLGVLLLMLSLLALTKHKEQLALLLLGLAISTKVFAILIAPFILLRCHVRNWYVLALTISACYLPFLLQSSSGLSGLLTFANEWQFNSLFYLLLLEITDFKTIKLISALTFCSLYAVLLWKTWRPKQANSVPPGDIIFALFFLLAPAVNAWYLIWLLAFAAIRPSYWAWTASVAVLLSYITGLTLDDQNMGLYEQPTWALYLEYGLVVSVLLLSYAIRFGYQRNKSFNI